MSPAIALVQATPEVCPLGGDVDAEHPVATRCDVLAGLEVRPRAGSLPMEARRYTGVIPAAGPSRPYNPRRFGPDPRHTPRSATKSPPRSAPAAWARYIGRPTRSSKRQVAIKVLPAAFAGDPERLARFQREAKILASLNHPNIAAIYGLEESRRACTALVMELVEGPTLAERIAQRRDSDRRGAAHREADRRGARSGARARHHPSRSEAGEHQGAATTAR